MIISGTGHRPPKLGGYSQKATDRLVKIAKIYLLQYKPELVKTGMALGWDTVLALACIELNIPFEAVIPFKGQELMWSAESRKIYNNILAKASKITYVCDPGYAPWKMQKRNEYLIDSLINKSDIVLSMWDGTDGGTANCIKYAKSKNKTIINCYSNFEQYKS